MEALLPVLLIVVGIIVLFVGSRLYALGAAVGVLLGVVLVHELLPAQEMWVRIGLPVAFGVIGLVTGLAAKQAFRIVLSVIGGVAGVTIVLALLELAGLNLGVWDWILAFVGGLAIALFVRYSTRWSMVFLSGIVGGLLIALGVGSLFAPLQGAVSWIAGLVAAGAGVAYQGGFIGGKKPAAS